MLEKIREFLIVPTDASRREKERQKLESLMAKEKEVMKTAGGLELLKGLATGLRDGGDKSVIVIEEKLSEAFPYTLILKHGSRLQGVGGELHIASKGVGIEAYSGGIEVRLTYPIGSRNWKSLIGDNFLYKHVEKEVKALSLEKQIFIAMKYSLRVPDEEIWRPNDNRWEIVF